MSPHHKVALLVQDGCIRPDLLAAKMGITFDAAHARLRRARLAGWVSLDKHFRYRACQWMFEMENA